MFSVDTARSDIKNNGPNTMLMLQLESSGGKQVQAFQASAAEKCWIDVGDILQFEKVG
jgi:hypothetical protein